MLFTNYILNFDVLGFGQFVKENSARVVFDYYAHIITGTSFAGEIVDADKLDVMVYSDTIAIKSNNEDQKSCLFSLIKVANLIQVGQYYTALSENDVFLPVRGAITFGEFIFHKGDIWTQVSGRPKISAKNIDMIIGKPIVESNEFEKEMELMCIALEESAQRQAGGDILADLLNSNLLVEYDIPLKENRKIKGIIVNPVSTPHLDCNLNKLEYERSKHAEDSSIQRKYANTIELFNYIRANMRYYPKMPT